MYIASDLIGALGRDPQQRTLDNGVLICTFDIACNISKDKPPVWVRITAWRELAERCAKYLRKGSKVFVHGTPAATAWNGNDGRLHAQLEVTASTVRFLSSKQDDEAAHAADQGETQQSSAPVDGMTPAADDNDCPW